jgi:hypothetical protein
LRRIASSIALDILWFWWIRYTTKGSVVLVQLLMDVAAGFWRNGGILGMVPSGVPGFPLFPADPVAVEILSHQLKIFTAFTYLEPVVEVCQVQLS